MQRVEILDDDDDDVKTNASVGQQKLPQPAAEKEPEEAPSRLSVSSNEASGGSNVPASTPNESSGADEKKGEVKAPPLVNTWDAERVSSALREANVHKTTGNELFAAGKLEEARDAYSAALEASAGCEAEKERSVFFANRAACFLAMHSAKEAEKDCDEALKIDDKYVKVWIRRAQAREKLEKLEDALSDFKRALQIDSTLSVAKQGIARLEPIVKERQEKQKAEMMEQLKGLGNTLLGKFGLSLDNFKLEQDPATGSYSVQFQQNK